MRLATIAQSRALDEASTKDYGLSAEVLMESAGALASREIDQFYHPELQRGTLAIVCGPGHNGGDGLVVARHLHSSGHRDLAIYLYAPEPRRSHLYRLQLERCRLQGIRIVDLEMNPEKLDQLRSVEVIVDALFGVGLDRALEGEYARLVDVMNSTKSPIVALDTPSGLHADTGVALGSVIKAAMTLTFGLAKPGFFTADGPQHVGRLRVLPIGFPYEALRGIATTHFLFAERLARRYLPSRRETANKSDFGHLLLIAGHEGMWGAGVLAATSAYRVGAGYVTWASFQRPHSEWTQVPEVLTDVIDLKKSVPWLIKKYSAVAVGPGLGVNEQTAELISELKRSFSGPVVIDADAITTCVQFTLFPLPSHWVMSPHSGELGRVLGVDSREIDRDRYGFAHQGARHTGCHVLLKGFRSILADGKRAMVINAGNSALAKAGTGDVLTGMIGGFLAQGVDTVQGSATASFIHGRMADEWVRVGHDRRSLSASDVATHLPQLMSRISGGTLF